MERGDRYKKAINGLLSSEQFKEISECLSNLAEKLRVSAVLLVNSSGEPVAQKVSSFWKGDTVLLSALTASSYSAAREMARILGENVNFKMVLHEGENHNIFISSISKDFFLIVIFQSGVALGMVRLFTKKTIEQLLPILIRRGEGNIRLDQIFDQQFQALLGEELDRSFKELS